MQSVRFSANSATLAELAYLFGSTTPLILVEDANQAIIGGVTPEQLLAGISDWLSQGSLATAQDLIIPATQFKLTKQTPDPFTALNLYHTNQIEYLILTESDRANWQVYGLNQILAAFQNSVLLRKELVGKLVQPLTIVETLAEAIAQLQTLRSPCAIFRLDPQTYSTITPRQLVQFWQAHHQALGAEMANLPLRAIFDFPTGGIDLDLRLAGIDPTETAANAFKEMQRRQIDHLVVIRGEQIQGALGLKSLIDQFSSQNMYRVIEQLDQDLNYTLSQKAELLLSCIERDQGSSGVLDQVNQFQLEQEYKISLATLKIRQSFSLDEIEEATVIEVAKWLKSDRVLLCQFLADGTEKLVAETVTSPQWAILGQSLSGEFSEVSWAEFYQRGIARVIDDVSEFPELGFLVELGVKSSLSVAIPYGKKLWGLLLVHQCMEPKTWEPTEIDFIERLAPRLSINFHQAKLLTNSLTEFEERRQVERKLIHNTFHDLLTDLPNRLMLLERLEALLQHSRHSFAVLLFDLNRFRLINDGLGHLVGDRLLQELVARLSNIEGIDLIARIGGDEFVLLLENLPDAPADQAIALAMAEQVHQCFAEPFALPEQGEGHSIMLSASAGVVISNQAMVYLSPVEILRDADATMDMARRQSLPYVVFEPSMRQGVISRITLEHDLRRALKQQDFRLHYQPIILPETGYLLGFEALLRWSDHQRGVVYPSEFIPVIEETGLIIPIGDWVMRAACAQLRQWQQEFPRSTPLWMGVNVSNIQLEQPNFVDQVLAVLAETGISPSCLHLEITESVLMQNFNQTHEKLERLRSLGIEILIDDFGTGYSSFSYLQNLPIDGLKIDRTFINRIAEDPSSYQIVQAIVNLARSLGKSLVAEGVETRQQLACFQEMGQSPAQGYYFSAPVESDLASEMVRRGYVSGSDRA
ncbi:MAG: EAL domain-containing protein [Pseudanabaenaceae cyanobacterium bins.68]|nr:EAL domain-containing protein [Pseudanabaenaceae cyanobacterium bins.68]